MFKREPYKVPIAIQPEALFMQVDSILIQGSLPVDDRHRQLFGLYIQTLQTDSFSPEEAIQTIRLHKAKEAAFIMINPKALEEYRKQHTFEETPSGQEAVSSAPSDVATPAKG